MEQKRLIIIKLNVSKIEELRGIASCIAVIIRFHKSVTKVFSVLMNHQRNIIYPMLICIGNLK